MRVSSKIEQDRPCCASRLLNGGHQLALIIRLHHGDFET